MGIRLILLAMSKQYSRGIFYITLELLTHPIKELLIMPSSGKKNLLNINEERCQPALPL